MDFGADFNITKISNLNVIFTFFFGLDMDSGKKNAWVCGLLTEISIYGTAIAYIITSAISLRYVVKLVPILHWSLFYHVTKGAFGTLTRQDMT